MTTARTRELVAVVLAAGAGSRLRPLTDLRPKPLCPVGNTALLDHALTRVPATVTRVAVNAHHHAAQIAEHLALPATRPAQLSWEQERALGTAGALGLLRDWIDGADVLVVNSDAYSPSGLDAFVAGWDGERIRLQTRRAGRPSDFGEHLYVGAALMPWQDVAALPAQPSGLYELSWAHADRDGRLELAPTTDPVIDCGTPLQYLEANLLASGGKSVIGTGCVVDGQVEQCVLWPGARVAADERLHRVIRVGADVTVQALDRPKLTGR